MTINKMNLFHNPTTEKLQIMIACCSDLQNFYDVIVDHDGEVMIKLSAETSTEKIREFRFCFRGLLRGRHAVGEVAAKNKHYIDQLFMDLSYCWSHQMHGIINHDDIAKIQSIIFCLKGSINRMKWEYTDGALLRSN
jgi:hypothetical protein